MRSLLNLSNGSPLNRLLDHQRTQLTRLVLFYWIKAKSAATAMQKLNCTFAWFDKAHKPSLSECTILNITKSGGEDLFHDIAKGEYGY